MIDSAVTDRLRQQSPVAQVRVRYADTDQMGVVYYANYLTWFEIGRTEWLRRDGWTYRHLETEGVFLPVITAHCEYARSARYDDLIDIHVSGRLLSPARLAFDYVLVRVADARCLATGYTEHATTTAAGRPVRIPAHIRELIA
jgi:acyl-CoA thioester hydrolase